MPNKPWRRREGLPTGTSRPAAAAWGAAPPAGAALGREAEPLPEPQQVDALPSRAPPEAEPREPQQGGTPPSRASVEASVAGLVTARSSATAGCAEDESAARFRQQVEELRACLDEPSGLADEQQLEEIEALAAIYDDALQVLSADGERPRLLRLELPTSLDGGGSAEVLVSTKDGEISAGSVENLPPAVLHCALPADYPLLEGRLPVCRVEAEHFGSRVVADLEAELQGMAQQRPGEAILFEWASTLQERLLLPQRVILRHECAGVDPMEVAQRLLAHNARVQDRNRRQEMHRCPLCFDEVIGARGVFLGCGHFGCKECLANMAQLHSSEADVNSLRCPIPDCREAFSPDVLRELLGDEAAMARCDELRLRQCLERMEDMAYCPRCDLDGKHVPCLQDEDHMAQCAICEFVFCGLCRGVYHPGRPCVSTAERIEALEIRARGTDDAAKKALSELQTLRELSRTTKNCPKCKMAIDKYTGCNKVHCTNCDALFCWRCLKVINGYDHFASSECRLFTNQDLGLPNQAVRQHEARFLAQFLNQAETESRCCPQCKAWTPRIGKNNHMKCHQCQTQFCARCRVVLPKKKASDHFQKERVCPQHSND